MIKIRWCLPAAISGFFVLLHAPSAFAADIAPTSGPGLARIEAETNPQGAIRTDSDCSGGKYVHRDGDYQPVFLAPLPKDGDSFVIWARSRGEALQLKGVSVDGKQKELNWIYDMPTGFTWESFGRHARPELGAQALIIKGPGATDDSGLDAVVFAESDLYDPRASSPVAASSDGTTNPVSAKITINWSDSIARTTALNFGSNDWAITDPSQTAGDSKFQAQLADLKITFLRVHNGGLTTAWTDANAKAWDLSKIQAAYRAPYLRGKTVLQNIPVWPSWMKQTDGMLDPSEYDEYASFCADLVDIVNNRLHKNVRYWEPLNEEDNNYAQHGNLDALWTIYDKCASAMKAKDSSIKVGGAAFTWDDPVKIESFLKHSAPQIDFLTWHRYASGSKDDPTDTIMSGTAAFGESAQRIRALADRYSPKRRIPLALDEFSVDWAWDSHETRQNTIVGAVWFASILKHMADSRTDLVASWNLKDGTYGLMDGADTPKPAAQVFAWGNRYLVGGVVKTVSDQPMVEAMAVRQADGSRSLLLINKMGTGVTVALRGLGVVKGAQVSRLDAEGVAPDPSAKSLLSKVNLTPYSLLLVRLGNKTIAAPKQEKAKAN